ncbi:hypothetical protein KGF57_003977 [Candida theae]|uniref:Chromatin modification-related protein n=1 Tax=Candida theae TaxID=1198502 RepID=A0AAD5BCJ1_9ASCO|nr:uncharacterized protein KGF57_003977 [Candida theae]KAI5953768.1 hypothetical protein KGF57_003977 [Candida theae]
MKETREYRRKEKQELQGLSEHKNRPRTITHLHELLPGLNDISDAFEALPLDIVKYFTLLKEIDAKCINTVPQINHRIKNYIDNLHVAPASNDGDVNGRADEDEVQVQALALARKQKSENSQLNIIKNKINEVIPCLEEKMHVTSVATDLLNKHMRRINQDYKLIIQNNEIPENIRIGPLVHPAMILDSTHPAKDLQNGNGEGATGNGNGGGGGGGNGGGYGHGSSTAQSQRSESRREALAARKANKDDDRDGGASGSNVSKKKRSKEQTPFEGGKSANGNNSSTGGSDKKRKNEDRSSTSSLLKKKKKGADDDGDIDGGDEDDGDDNGVNSRSDGRKSSSANLDKSKGTASNSGAGGGAGSSGGSGGSHEPTYCYCNQVSFGEMVGCDGEDCKREWFHLPCIGFKNPPKGKWYCDDCLKNMKVKKL